VWAGLYAALGPSALCVWTGPEGLRLAGWTVCGAGLLFTLVAQAQMGASWRIGIDERPTGLVSHGLFRVVRNPVFTGMLLTLSGLVLVSPSPWTLMAWLHALLLISLQARLEERHLLDLHGEAYRRYASRVGRFVPGLGRLAEG
jgi:protein-S-isoprenylcysteine O-methyltransferase Ste14